MARYVDIDLYLDTVKQNAPYIHTIASLMMSVVPAADVVEVVRCEKCKYRTEVTECNHTLYFCRKKQNYIKLNDFCSYGDRRTNNGINAD